MGLEGVSTGSPSGTGYTGSFVWLPVPWLTASIDDEACTLRGTFHMRF